MEATATAQGGRVVVNLHDDSGKPYKFISDAVSLIGVSEYNELLSIPLTEDKNAVPPRPPCTRGQVLLSAQAVFSTSSYDYVLADVLVVGYVGSTATIIGRTQLGGDAQLDRIAFQEDDTFDRIAILARQLVNGASSSVTANIQVLQLSAIAIMWS